MFENVCIHSVSLQHKSINQHKYLLHSAPVASRYWIGPAVRLQSDASCRFVQWLHQQMEGFAVSADRLLTLSRIAFINDALEHLMLQVVFSVVVWNAGGNWLEYSIRHLWIVWSKEPAVRSSCCTVCSQSCICSLNRVWFCRVIVPGGFMLNGNYAVL